MKNIFKIVSVLFILCTIGLFTACPEPSAIPGKITAGNGAVYISIAGAGQRTVFPTGYEDLEISFEATAAGQEAVEGDFEDGEAEFELRSGLEWTIVITAKDSDDVAVGTATIVVNVVSGAIHDFPNVLIVPITGGDDGTLDWDVTFPAGDDYEIATLTISTDPVTEIDLQDVGTDEQPLDLAPGSYIVRAKIQRVADGKIAGKTQAVHIYSGMTTELSWAFTADDFKDEAYYFAEDLMKLIGDEDGDIVNVSGKTVTITDDAAFSAGTSLYTFEVIKGIKLVVAAGKTLTISNNVYFQINEDGEILINGTVDVEEGGVFGLRTWAADPLTFDNFATGASGKLTINDGARFVVEVCVPGQFWTDFYNYIGLSASAYAGVWAFTHEGSYVDITNKADAAPVFTLEGGIETARDGAAILAGHEFIVSDGSSMTINACSNNQFAPITLPIGLLIQGKLTIEDGGLLIGYNANMLFDDGEVEGWPPTGAGLAKIITDFDPHSTWDEFFAVNELIKAQEDALAQATIDAFKAKINTKIVAENPSVDGVTGTFDISEETGMGSWATDYSPVDGHNIHLYYIASELKDKTAPFELDVSAPAGWTLTDKTVNITANKTVTMTYAIGNVETDKVEVNVIYVPNAQYNVTFEAGAVGTIWITDKDSDVVAGTRIAKLSKSGSAIGAIGASTITVRDNAKINVAVKKGDAAVSLGADGAFTAESVVYTVTVTDSRTEVEIAEDAVAALTATSTWAEIAAVNELIKAAQEGTETAAAVVADFADAVKAAFEKQGVASWITDGGKASYPQDSYTTRVDIYIIYSELDNEGEFDITAPAGWVLSSNEITSDTATTAATLTYAIGKIATDKVVLDVNFVPNAQYVIEFPADTLGEIITINDGTPQVANVTNKSALANDVEAIGALGVTAITASSGIEFTIDPELENGDTPESTIYWITVTKKAVVLTDAEAAVNALTADSSWADIAAANTKIKAAQTAGENAAAVVAKFATKVKAAFAKQGVAEWISDKGKASYPQDSYETRVDIYVIYSLLTAEDKDSFAITVPAGSGWELSGNAITSPTATSTATLTYAIGNNAADKVEIAVNYVPNAQYVIEFAADIKGSEITIDEGTPEVAHVVNLLDTANTRRAIGGLNLSSITASADIEYSVLPAITLDTNGKFTPTSQVYTITVTEKASVAAADTAVKALDENSDWDDFAAANDLIITAQAGGAEATNVIAAFKAKINEKITTEGIATWATPAELGAHMQDLVPTEVFSIYLHYIYSKVTADALTITVPGGWVLPSKAVDGETETTSTLTYAIGSKGDKVEVNVVYRPNALYNITFAADANGTIWVMDEESDQVTGALAAKITVNNESVKRTFDVTAMLGDAWIVVKGGDIKVTVTKGATPVQLGTDGEFTVTSDVYTVAVTKIATTPKGDANIRVTIDGIPAKVEIGGVVQTLDPLVNTTLDLKSDIAGDWYLNGVKVGTGDEIELKVGTMLEGDNVIQFKSGAGAQVETIIVTVEMGN